MILGIQLQGGADPKLYSCSPRKFPMENFPSRIPVHLEVAVRPSPQVPDVMRQYVLEYLRDHEAVFRVGNLAIPSSNPLSSYVEVISVTQCGTTRAKVGDCSESFFFLSPRSLSFPFSRTFSRFIFL